MSLVDRPHPVRLRAAAGSSGPDDDDEHLHLEGRFYAAQLPGGAPALLLLLCTHCASGEADSTETCVHPAGTRREGESTEASMHLVEGTSSQASLMYGLGFDRL